MLTPGTLKRGIQNPRGAARYAKRKLIRKSMAARLALTSRYPIGTNVLNREWDVLVVLDTCRVDALRETVHLLPDGTPDEVSGYLSLGSQTAEWLCQTFRSQRRSEIERLGYVAGNAWAGAVFDAGERPEDCRWFDDISLSPFSVSWNVVDRSAFGAFVPAWTLDTSEFDIAHGSSGSHPSPRVVTDRTIALHRSGDLNRVIAHYIQPHFPYEALAIAEGRSELHDYERSPIPHLRNGGDREKVWNAYMADLRRVLEEVAGLFENVDGTIAVTADHGEAFGEYGQAGHRPTMVHPHVRRVPWFVGEATDRKTRDPKVPDAEDESSGSVEERLEVLGYRL